WSDELDIALAAYFGKMRVFREEAVTRVDCFDVGNFGSADEPIDLEVAVCRCRRADAYGFVGEAEVRRPAVRFAIHGDNFNAEITARADDPQCDFTAIGHKNSLKHKSEIRNPKSEPDCIHASDIGYRIFFMP